MVRRPPRSCRFPPLTKEQREAQNQQHFQHSFLPKVYLFNRSLQQRRLFLHATFDQWLSTTCQVGDAVVNKTQSLPSEGSGTVVLRWCLCPQGIFGNVQRHSWSSRPGEVIGHQVGKGQACRQTPSHAQASPHNRVIQPEISIVLRLRQQERQTFQQAISIKHNKCHVLAGASK